MYRIDAVVHLPLLSMPHAVCLKLWHPSLSADAVSRLTVSSKTHTSMVRHRNSSKQPGVQQRSTFQASFTILCPEGFRFCSGTLASTLLKRCCVGQCGIAGVQGSTSGWLR